MFLHNYIQTSGTGNTWQVSIQFYNEHCNSYFEEVVKTTVAMLSKNCQPVYLLYSGGMDSEYMLNVLRFLGIEFTTVVIELSPGYNRHDLEYAFLCLNKYNIKPKVITLDFDWFVKSGTINTIAEQIKCSAYQIPATLFCLLDLNGFVILGNDPPYIKNINGIWKLEELEAVHSIITFFKLHSLSGHAFPLYASAAAQMSFLTHPRIVQLGSNQLYGKLGSNSSKVEVYNSQPYFTIEPRIKYTGYETIETSPIFLHNNIKQFSEYPFNGVWYTDYLNITKGKISAGDTK